MGRGGAYIKCTCTLTTSGASSLSSSSSSSSSSSTPPPPYIGYSNHTMRASITAPKTVITSLDVIGSRYWNRCQRLIKIPESMAQNIEKLNQRSKFMYVRKIHARLDGLKSLKCLVYFTTCSDCTCALTLYYQPSLHFNEKICWPKHATIDQGSNLNSWAHDSTSATSRPCSVSIIRCCTTNKRKQHETHLLLVWRSAHGRASSLKLVFWLVRHPRIGLWWSVTTATFSCKYTKILTWA